MKKAKRGMGEIERLLFAYLQMRKQTTVRTGELVEPLRLSVPRERNLLSRLARAGWIARVRRGVYLVPARLPLGGAWSPGEIKALNALMDDVKGRCQICGPNTFNRYGWDDQVPNRVYAYNNRLSGDRKVGSVELTLIKVNDDRLGDTDRVTMPDGEKAVYGSRARALVDAVYDWSRFDGIPRAYRWIREELRRKRVTAAELARCTLRYGDVGTIRRMGALLERDGAHETLLRKLEQALAPTTSTIPWIPTLPKRGTVNRRWGVVVNDSEL
jgi:predicted transcriptional regulator of viral defense system